MTLNIGYEHKKIKLNLHIHRQEQLLTTVPRVCMTDVHNAAYNSSDNLHF